MFDLLELLRNKHKLKLCNIKKRITWAWLGMLVLCCFNASPNQRHDLLNLLKTSMKHW